MKVKIDGKTYCVETLIFDNKRLRGEVIASAKLHRMILDEIRAKILRYRDTIDKAIAEDSSKIEGMKEAYNDCLEIIDKYKAESEG